MFATMAAVWISTFSGFAPHNDRPLRRLDRLAHVPGVARLERLTTMRTFTQVALDDYALGVLKYSSRSMAGLFRHGVCLRLNDLCTITEV